MKFNLTTSIFFFLTIFILILPQTLLADVNLSFDSSYPKDKADIVQTFHDKIIPILDKVTGQSPDIDFVLMYTPTTHIGFNSDGTILYDQYLPGGKNQYQQTFNWFWWYLIEITHFYIPRLNIWQDNIDLYNKYNPYFNPYMATREREYMSHTVVQYIIATYGGQLDGFVDSDLFYQNITNAWSNPVRDQSIMDISPQTAFQVDTNYNNFNPIACDIAGGLFFKFAYADSTFIKRLFTNMSGSAITTVDDYFNVVAASINGGFIDGTDKETWLKNHPYFARYDDENLSKYSMDIITFAKKRTDSYARHNISSKDIQYFIITGSSSANYLPGTADNNLMDENFFGQPVNYTIKDLFGNIVDGGSTQIAENTWSNIVYLPALSAGQYIIETDFTTLDGVVLTDQETIYVTGQKSLFDAKHNLLILKDITYQGVLIDIIGFYDSETNSFIPTKITLETEQTQSNGSINDFENIYVNNIMVGNQFFDAKMRFDGKALYVTEIH